LVTLVRWAPDDVRARLVSVCSSLLLGVQGIGPLIFGLVASGSSPALAVTWAGAVGTVAAVVAVACGRSHGHDAQHRANR
ncbi:MAG: hypothetical protein INR67_18880, partial [Jatrophihabitans endophyticus]